MTPAAVKFTRCTPYPATGDPDFAATSGSHGTGAGHCEDRGQDAENRRVNDNMQRVR